MTLALLLWFVQVPFVQASTGDKSGMPSPTRSIVNVLIALAVVVLLMFLLFRFLAKRTNVSQKGMIQVIAARQLAPNRSIQVVEVGDKRYLLGVGEDVQLLADVTDTYELAERNEERTSFGQALSSALADLRRKNPEDQ